MRANVPAPEAVGSLAGTVSARARAGAVEAVLALGTFLKTTGMSLIQGLDEARRFHVDVKRRFHLGE